MTGLVLTKECAERFRRKLCSPKVAKKWDIVFQTIFTERTCKKILDFFSPIIKIFTSRQV